MSQVRVAQTKWRIEDCALRKLYVYPDYPGLDAQLSLQIVISRTRGLRMGETLANVDFLICPSLWPAEKTNLVAQLNALRPKLDYPRVKVHVSSDADQTMIVRPKEALDADVLLDALSKCRLMQLLLTDGKTLQLTLPLPNDWQFGAAARAYLSCH